MPVTIEYYEDHLLLRMVGPAALASLRRQIVVPYSDVLQADAAPPRWPSMIKEWRVGTHMPGLIASGLFSTWQGHRRFLHFDRSNKRVLTMRLAGHSGFEEISVALAAPDEAAKEINRRLAGGKR